jgi:hypothetical protein
MYLGICNLFMSISSYILQITIKEDLIKIVIEMIIIEKSNIDEM